jgi:uncharacterized protein (DUF58 family)
VRPAATPAPERNFLDPGVLARIGNLQLLAKTVVQGFINGIHRSPSLGSSTDFAEHRAYMPGDDIRRIDWRLFGRTDRHFVKQFEADTNTNMLIVLDVSRSMRYRGDPSRPSAVSKLEYGCYLAASLAYFSSQQRDRVGLATVDGDLRDFVPCSAKHLQLVLHSLDRVHRAAHSPIPSGETAAPAGELLPALRKLAENTKRRSIVVLISDLYEEPTAVLDALTQVRGRGNDLIVFHVLDKTEIDFSFTDSSSFVDVETGVKMPVIPEYLRTQYKAMVAAHTAALAKLAREQRVDYQLLDTSRPLDEALFAYLAARERAHTVR